jgi:hypothetical protein
MHNALISERFTILNIDLIYCSAQNRDVNKTKECQVGILMA